MVINKAAGSRIVFDYDNAVTEGQSALLEDITAVQKSLGARTQVVIVAHGAGLRLVHRSRSAVAHELASLREQNVTFVACSRSMALQGISADELVPGTLTVDSGVAELVRRQENGWSYIKRGH